MKVLLSVPLFHFSGYGKDGIALADLFYRAGFDVYLDPDGAVPPLPAHIAQMFVKEPQLHYDLHLKQFDPGRIKASVYEREHTDLLLGWTMWEWTDLDARIGPDSLEEIPARTKNFHAIACYDQNTVEAVRPHFHPGVYQFQSQGGYDAHGYPKVERDFTERPFKFGMYGALTPRKGPFYAIEAFRALRERRPELEVELHLKSTEHGLHPGIEQWSPGVFIYSDIWGEARIRHFVRHLHCLLCPSLGEGKNMAALEFLSSGGPAVCTNWGGHTVWLSDEFAWPLECTTAKEYATRNAYRAEPSVEHLSYLMEYIVDHPEEVKRKGDLASRIVPQMFSWETTTLSLFERLRNINDPTLSEKARQIWRALRSGLEVDSERRRARDAHFTVSREHDDSRGPLSSSSH